MYVESVQSKKGELLVILEEDDGVYLCCRPNGIQMHFERMQLCENTFKELPLHHPGFSEKQRLAFKEYTQQMEKSSITYSNFRQTA